MPIPYARAFSLGATPVISPTARGDDGKIYNCNADIAAAKTAIALNARRLVFMSDVPGLLRDPTDNSTLMSHLRVEEVPELKRARSTSKKECCRSGQRDCRDRKRRGESAVY